MKLTPEEIAHLGLSPLSVIHFVAAPTPLSESQIIQAVEYGLTYQQRFAEAIFELLKSNLHKFHAHFAKEWTEEGWEEQLRLTRAILDRLELPEPHAADFSQALIGLAGYVAGPLLGADAAGGGTMAQRAERVAELFRVAAD